MFQVAEGSAGGNLPLNLVIVNEKQEEHPKSVCWAGAGV